MVTASCRELNGIHNKLIRRDREKFVQNKADEIEKATRKKCIGSLFKHLRDFTESKAPKVGPVVSGDGTLLSDESSCLDLWKEHFSSHLNRTTPPMVADEILCPSPSHQSRGSSH